MPRFDVYAYADDVPYLLDVQADLLSDLQTRVVVPLLPQASVKKEALPRLKPVVKVKGKSYLLMMTDIAAVRTADLGAKVCNIGDQRDVITGALDFLFQGF